jgi:hypothetical protein
VECGEVPRVFFGRENDQWDEPVAAQMKKSGDSLDLHRSTDAQPSVEVLGRRI